MTHANLKLTEKIREEQVIGREKFKIELRGRKSQEIEIKQMEPKRMKKEVVTSGNTKRDLFWQNNMLRKPQN